MKKIFIIFYMVAFVFFVGASNTATLVVNGVVNTSLDVAFTGSPITVNFVGDGSAGVPTGTATLTAKSNLKSWKLSFDSANNGNLHSATANADIPYFVQVTAPTWGIAEVTNGLASAVNPEGAVISVIKGRTPRNGVNFIFTVSVPAQGTGDDLYDAATDYTDSLVITISAL